MKHLNNAGFRQRTQTLIESDGSQVEDLRRRSKAAEDQSRKKPTGRNSSSDVICFEIHEEDDLAVAAIKEAVNAAQITLDEVYERVGRGTGWNYYYGILTRRTTTMRTLQAWGEILGLEARVELRPAEPTTRSRRS